MREWLQLLQLRVIVEWRSFVEYLKVVRRYYPSISFAKTDLLLLVLYLFSNPFRMVRRSGATAPYGETPLTTMDRIAQESNISAKDTVLELGSGRGRAVFWLQAFRGCSVIGIDSLPAFISRAAWVATKRKLQKVTFRLEDMFTTDQSQATVIYLYGTCLDEDEIRQLIDQMRILSAGTRIITVSYPLTDYTSPQEPIFEVSKQFTAAFTWGEAEVYIQEVLKKSR